MLKIVFRILAGFGFLMVIATVAVGTLVMTATSNSDRYGQTAVSAIRALASDPEGYRRLTSLDPRFVKGMDDGARNLVVPLMTRFGPLVSATDIRHVEYNLNVQDATTAIIQFKAVFERGAADITVLLHKSEAGMKLLRLDLKNLRTKTGERRIET